MVLYYEGGNIRDDNNGIPLPDAPPDGDCVYCPSSHVLEAILKEAHTMRLSFFRTAAVFPALLLFSCLSLTGCSEKEATLTELRAAQGADQCTTAPDGSFPLPLRIEARGGFGGTDTIPNIRLHLSPKPGSQLTFDPASGVTDGGGSFSTRITASGSGDQFFTVSAEGYPEHTLTLRVINGMEIRGDNSEAVAGSCLPHPIAVRLIRNGKPLSGVPVRFEMRSTAEGAETTAQVFTPLCPTDENGVASTRVQLGEATGVYRLGINVDGQDAGISVRNREVRLLGINPWAVSIAVLGGVAFFIFGMNLMSDGLRAAAGDNMKKILQLFTHNRVTALLAGTAVTAVLPSSAAVTVMVIGFINAGLLTLKQSLGIIFGANIGTTVTAQIISFDLSAAALPAVVIGLLMSFSTRRTLKGWGLAILGFGILFFGLTMMGNELKLLSDIPSFKRVFLLFDCAPETAGGIVPPLALAGAILLGFIGTVLLQSSSAFTGVVLALAASGLVNFYTAFALLLGSNVGTTVTTLLASVRVNRVAKQAALAHFIFNLFGAIVMTLLFYVPWRDSGHPVFLALVNASTPGDAFAAIPQNLERHIAMAHTLFNVTVSVLLLPFITQFTWLCNKLLPIRDESGKRIRMLEPGLLATPSVALKQCAAAIRLMVIDAWTMIDRSINEHFIPGSTKARRIEEIARMESGVDAMQKEITDYLVQLMRRPLTGPQSELIPLLMHATNDAERIADHAENIIALTRRMVSEKDKLSDAALKSLRKMWEVLDDEAKNVIAGLDGVKSKQVKVALKDERKINKMADRLESEHIERLRKGNCSAPSGVVYIEILGELEKIGDRLSNIAERTPQIQQQYVRL